MNDEEAILSIKLACIHHGEWHNNVYDPRQRLPPEGTSVTIACSWTRSMHFPAFRRTNAMVAWPGTPLAHSFCSADGSPNNQQL